MNDLQKKFEREFYKTLEDIFIGERLEGQSGYINLLKIKSSYYTNVMKPDLERFINNKLLDKGIEDFREELFEKLYTFFKRYFSESGSIYFTYTPWSERIYERVYDPEKDVALFWKTHMLYYVKSERLYKSLELKIKGENGKEFTIYFDATEIEHQKANEKRELIYEFDGVKDDKIILKCKISEKGRKTKEEEIVKAIKSNKIDGITTDDLERAIRIFEKQSEVDFFINKDAEKFLKEQLDMFIYQYMFNQKNIWGIKRINEIQTFKEVAEKIIEFISQFENELVKIWNKPKFVFNSNYVITLDRIANADKNFVILNKIISHPNIHKQIEEWKELELIEEDFEISDLINSTNMFGGLNEKYKFLPIDTKYFKDIEMDILELFDNLDEQLDGVLIKSENYQALNTILRKYREKVQTIYIDPPFNKEQEADYFYKVNYKDASWITMLENRIALARELLNETGSIFVRCDYNGNMYVRLLMNEIFGEENFRNEIVLNRVSKQDPKVKKFNTATDSLFFFSKSAYVSFFALYIEGKEKPQRWHSMDSQGQGRPQRIFGFEFEPPKGRHWSFSGERLKQMEIDGRLRIVCRKCGYTHLKGTWTGCPECGNLTDVRIEYLLDSTSQKQIDSNWTDVSGYTFNWSFPTENSEILLKRVLESTSERGDLVMDFFLGSGTTVAVAHKLGRKWIGVEMGEHFYSVILPRMKKVLAYDKSGISKEKDVKEFYNEKNAGGFFKYYELEQYEEVLRNAKYLYGDISLQPTPGKDSFNEYIFMRDPKFVEDAIVRDGDDFKIDFSRIYKDKSIDVAETISNVTGKRIRKICKDYFVLEEIGIIRYDDIPIEYAKELIWW